MLDSDGSSVATTEDFPSAVALATYGYPHRLERLRNEVTGDVVSHLFHMEPHATAFEPITPGEIPWFKGAEKMPIASTFLRIIRDGTLQRNDPGHHILDCFYALHILECVRSFMERGRAYRIGLIANSGGRCALSEGQEPATDSARATVEVEQLELAVALIRLGVPLVRCEGVKPYRRIVLAATGYPIHGHLMDAPDRPSWLAIDGSCDAAKLAASIGDGTLAQTDPGHPALWSIIAIRNRRAIKREMDSGIIPLLLHNPRSHAWARRKQSSIVPGNATGRTIDRARQILRI